MRFQYVIADTVTCHSRYSMDKIRLGNDIEMRWSIFTRDGDNKVPYDLEGRALTLSVVNRKGESEIEFFAEGNIVTGVFRGRDQKILGKHGVILRENNGGDGMRTVDACDAFELVACSCEEALGSPGTIQLFHLTFDTTIGAITGTIDPILNYEAEQAEAERKASEIIRKIHEEARQEAEAARQKASSEAVATANAAAENAQQKAEEAASSAASANSAASTANEAAGTANAAAASANEAATNADKKAELANEAAYRANTAADLAHDESANASSAALAANKAADSANAAAGNANIKAEEATNAAISANSAAKAANAAASKADNAAVTAQQKAEAASNATEAATSAAESANSAADNAQQKAQAAQDAAVSANSAAEAANTAAEAADTAAGRANEAVDKFNAAIVQETGDSQDKVMSQKTVTDALTASDQKLSELNSIIRNTEEDGFYVTDSTGKVLAMITKSSIDAIDFGENLSNIIRDVAETKVAESSQEKYNVVGYTKAFNSEYVKLNKIRDEIQSMMKSVEGVKDTNGNTFQQSITIPMASQSSDIERGVFRIGLHYGAQLGDRRWNEIFFNGNVKTDFSDVRVKDSSGNILPARLLHCGNYEVVKDHNIRGFYDDIWFKDGKAYAVNSNRICYTEDEFVTFKQLGINQTISVSPSSFFIDNADGVWFVDANTYDVYVCYPVNSVYDFSNQILVANLLYTNGTTNYGTTIRFTCACQDDLGYVYFGVYQANFNAVIFRTCNPVVNGTLSPDAQGKYVFECYNQPRVYKSGTEDIDPDYCDQHVHHIHIFYSKDSNNNDVCNIIAGLDNSLTNKGPNIISSIDRGQTWISFRDTIDLDWAKNIKGHDYSFAWMSDDNSFTLCGGESNILGGYTISKMLTKVEPNGRIVPTDIVYPLSTKSGIREPKSGKNCIIVPLPAVEYSHYNNIIVSRDNAKTWQSIYSEFEKDYNGVGYGVRKLTDAVKFNSSEDATPCHYGVSTITNLPSLRVYEGGNHYYGEMLVDVGELEAGIDKTIIIESGYLTSQAQYEVLNRGNIKPIWELPLNEGSSNCVTDSDGRTHKIIGNYEWLYPINTMQYGGYIPYLQNYNEVSGLRLEPGAYIDLGILPNLKFNKSFSLVFWIAYGNLSKGNYGASYADDYYFKKFPIISNKDFSIGRVNSSFYVGGSDTQRTRVSCALVKNPYMFYPVMITVNNDSIPLISVFLADERESTEILQSAESWPNALLSDSPLRIGTEECDVSVNTGSINKNFFLKNIAIYDRVLTRDEFMSIVHGRTLNDSFNNISK